MDLQDAADRLVKRIEDEVDGADAFFSLITVDRGTDEYFIRANEQGLQLLAAELLKASFRVQEVIEDEEQTLISLDGIGSWWSDGDIFIDYVEPVLKSGEAAPTVESEPTWIHMAAPWGCLILVVGVIVLAVIGLLAVFGVV